MNSQHSLSLFNIALNKANVDLQSSKVRHFVVAVVVVVVVVLCCFFFASSRAIFIDCHRATQVKCK